MDRTCERCAVDGAKSRPYRVSIKGGGPGVTGRLRALPLRRSPKLGAVIQTLNLSCLKGMSSIRAALLESQAIPKIR